MINPPTQATDPLLQRWSVTDQQTAQTQGSLTNTTQTLGGVPAGQFSLPVSPLQAAVHIGAQQYGSMNNAYQLPLQTTPIFTAPPGGLSQEQLDQLVASYSAVGSHPVVSGQHAVHPASPTAPKDPFTWVGHLPGNIAQAGFQIGQQTIGDFVHQVQVDPGGTLLKAGLITAAVVGAAAVAPEAAAVIGGALMLYTLYTEGPQFLQALGDTWHDPSDKNVTKLLVSGGTIGMSATPIKWLRDIRGLRAGLDGDFAAVKTASTPRDVLDKVLTPVTDRSEADPNRWVRQQFPLVPQSSDELMQTIQERGLQGEASAKALLQETRQHEQFAARLREAEPGSPAFGDLRRQMEEHREIGLLPAMQEFAAQFPFRVMEEPVHSFETPMAAERLQEVGEEAMTAIDRDFAPVKVVLDSAFRGHAYTNTLSDTEVEGDARALAERTFSATVGGGLADTENRLKLDLRRMLQREGIPNERMEDIWQSIEGRFDEAGNELPHGLSAKEEYIARHFADLFNRVSVHLYRQGKFDTPLARWVPRWQVLKGEESEASMEERSFRSSRGRRAADVVRSRNYELQSQTMSDDWSEAYALGTEGTAAGERTTAQMIRPTVASRADMMQRNASDESRWQANSDLSVLVDRHGDTIKRYRDQLRGRRVSLAAALKRGDEAKAQAVQKELDAFAERVARETGDERLGDLVVNYTGKALNSLKKGRPPRELVSGYSLMERLIHNSLWAAHEADVRREAESLGNLYSDRLSSRYGGVGRFHVGRLKAGERPAIVSEQHLDDQAKGHYELFMRAVGNSNSINYKPALYMRRDLLVRYKDMVARATSPTERADAFTHAVYDVLVSAPKRALMYSPLWHMRNVAGRAMALMVRHPGLAGHIIMQNLRGEFENPARMALLRYEAAADGWVPAAAHDIRNDLHWLDQGETGQKGFAHALRTPLGPVRQFYGHLVEGGFWKAVEDVALAGYRVEKEYLKRKYPDANERVLGMVAAHYANNIGGQVNRLYMGRMFQLARQMLFFAPSWWTTFYRMLAMTVPGAARMSHLIATDKRFAKLGAFDPVKFHALDYRMRKEMVRAHRSFFLTYMMTGLIVHDLLNQVFSGHHMWDNPKGHEFDLMFDRTYRPSGNEQLGTERHIGIKGDLFFSQMADLGNMIGLGHDWGFPHIMGEQQYQQADAVHKAMMLAQGMATGVNNEMAGKASTGLNFAVTAGMGIDSYSLFRNHQAIPVDRSEALADLLPSGYQDVRLMKQIQDAEQKAQLTGDPQAKAKADALRQQAGMVGGLPMGQAFRSLVDQGIGLPDLQAIGDEQVTGYNLLTPQQHAQYLQDKADLDRGYQAISDQAMSGQIDFARAVQDRDLLTQRYLQMQRDYFGQQSAGGKLYELNQSLTKQFHLDDPSLTDEQRSVAIHAKDEAMQQALSSADADTRQLYWDAKRRYFTDFDYLHWMVGQVRHSLAGAIDGHNGDIINQQEQLLGPFMATLPPDQADAIRQQFPQYYAYRILLRELGQTSLLGSLVSSFYSSGQRFKVLPAGLSPEMISYLQQQAPSGETLVRAEDLQPILQQSEQLAGDTTGTATLGQLEQAQTPVASGDGSTPGTLGQGLTQAAQQALSDNPNLSPQVVAILQQLAQNVG